MSTKSVSLSSSQTIPKCEDYKTLLQGLAKGYVDCGEWCQQKCPVGFSPAQTAQIAADCKKECERFQALSPAGRPF